MGKPTAFTLTVETLHTLTRLTRPWPGGRLVALPHVLFFPNSFNHSPPRRTARHQPTPPFAWASGNKLLASKGDAKFLELRNVRCDRLAQHAQRFICCSAPLEISKDPVRLWDPGKDVSLQHTHAPIRLPSDTHATPLQAGLYVQ